MTPRAEALAREILESAAGVFYVAGNETQRRQAVKEAARVLEPRLRAIEARAAADAAANPS